MKTYRLKELEWREQQSWKKGREWACAVPFGIYGVLFNDGTWSWSWYFEEFHDEGRSSCASLEDGKAKAWENWQVRILPALEEIQSKED